MSPLVHNIKSLFSRTLSIVSSDSDMLLMTRTVHTE